MKKVGCRNYLLGLAGVLCTLTFATTANAQFTPVCTASVANPFAMRAEGATEQAGDVVLACSGGTPTAAGAPIPALDFIVTGNANITTRLLNSTTMVNEALLLVDEPGSGSLFGLPSFPIAICPSSGSGSNDCPMTGSGLGGGVGRPTYNPAAGGARYNAFQGVRLTDNQVIFRGVPFDPPANGEQLILRVTNIRMNAYSLTVQGNGTSFPQAFVTISAAAGLSINNPVQVAGEIYPGLTGQSVTNPSTLGQCNSTSSSLFPTVETVNFSEGLATATRLRVPASGTAPLGIPGNFQDTESQFVPPVSPQGAYIGIADAGTRMKVTIGNVPAGVQVYVPTVLSSAQNSQGAPLETFQLTASELGLFSAVPASSVPGASRRSRRRTELPSRFMKSFRNCRLACRPSRASQFR